VVVSVALLEEHCGGGGCVFGWRTGGMGPWLVARNFWREMSVGTCFLKAEVL